MNETNQTQTFKEQPMNSLERLEGKKVEFQQRWNDAIISLFNTVRSKNNTKTNSIPTEDNSTNSIVYNLETISNLQKKSFQGKADLIFLSGANGVGKDTLIREALTHYPISKTLNTNTRGIRPNEIDGGDAYFWNENQFTTGLKEKKFIWYDLKHHGKPQGLLRSELLDKSHADRTTILDSRIHTASLLKNDPDIKKLSTVSLYVLPPSFDEWYRRLIDRSSLSPTEDVVERVEVSLDELEEAKKICDVYVVNDDVKRATDIIASYFKPTKKP